MWYIYDIMGCFLGKNIVYCAQAVVKTASHRHTIAGKPLWVWDRGCDDYVTECDGRKQVSKLASLKV